jgi:hypothetical protein
MLRHTMRWVVPVLVHQLLSHPLLTLPLESKVILVTICTTIPTIDPDGFWFRLGLGLLTWHHFLLLSNHIFVGIHKSHRFFEVVCLGRKHW